MPTWLNASGTLPVTSHFPPRASWRAMEKIGMRREGLLRQDRRVKGAWRDTYLYAILATDWSAARL